MLSLPASVILLTVIFGSIFGANYLVLFLQKKHANRRLLMNRFMGSVFIIFGVLKLVNLKKFVEIFSKYDLISQKVGAYAYLFPFIEIGIGCGLLAEDPNGRFSSALYITVLVLMSLNIVAVLISRARGQKLRCGCLGSFFHIPLSYVSLSENALMIAMASVALA